jgi:DNA mismatch repair protein MutS
MFATHYHELTDCAAYLPRVQNFHLAVKETGSRVEYLHRVEPGRAEKSFGIHVAEIAGLPKPVIRRARALLNEHETNGRPKITAPHSASLTWLSEALRKLDLNAMSPVEALTTLFELQTKLKT